MKNETTRVMFYADLGTWTALKKVAPHNQFSRFMRFVLADVVSKIRNGEYEEELARYERENALFSNAEDQS